MGTHPDFPGRFTSFSRGSLITIKKYGKYGNNDGNMGIVGEIIGKCGDLGTGKMELEATWSRHGFS